MNKEEKAKLWADRIQQYKTSGQTCKQWCAENDIPLSTMGYWTRRLAKEDPASEPEQDLVFARVQSEREAARKRLSEETAPLRIFVADSITRNKNLSCTNPAWKSAGSRKPTCLQTGTDGIHTGIPAAPCLTWQEEQQYIFPAESLI